MALTLPSGLVAAEGTSPRILILYGPPKVGKTTLLSVLPDSLLVDIEDGSDYVTATKVKLSNPMQLGPLVDAVKAHKPPYNIIAYDTIDALETWAEQEATRSYKASIMGKSFGGDSVLELAKGGGYYFLRNTFNAFFSKLCTTAKYVIFTAHVRDKMLTIESKDVASVDLDLTGKIRNIVCSYSDAIGHVFRDKTGKLQISFNTTETMQCGSRCEHLKGKTFTFDTPPTKENWKQIYPHIV